VVDMMRLQFEASAWTFTGSSADVRRSNYQNTTFQFSGNTTSELWTNIRSGDNFNYVKYQ